MVPDSEGKTRRTAKARCVRGLAWSKTPSMRGNTLRENRETLRPSTGRDVAVGRDGKSEDSSHR